MYIFILAELAINGELILSRNSPTCLELQHRTILQKDWIEHAFIYDNQDSLFAIPHRTQQHVIW